MNVEDRLKNYYEILEIPYDSSHEQIHEGYVRAKNAYSGESVALYSIMTKEECAGMLELIETAYSVLSIPNKRKEYDKARGIVHSSSSGRGMTHSHSSSSLAAHPSSTSSSPSSFNGHNGQGDHSSEMIGEMRPSDETTEHSSSKSNFQPSMAMSMSMSMESSSYQSGFSTGLDHKEFQINRSDVEVSKIAASKRFRLEYSKDANFEQEIENASLFNGALLKKIREYKNVTVDRMSDLTKISRTYLNQIENDELEKLPALAYVRGFVYQYAKVLKLPPDLVAASYLNHVKQLQKQRSG